MKRFPRRLLLIAALLLLIASPWLLLPHPRGRFYELLFRTGPPAWRSWCIDQLRDLGAEGAPSLVALMADEPGVPDHGEYQEKAARALLDGGGKSLPALAQGLGAADPVLRRKAAYILFFPLWGPPQTTLHNGNGMPSWYWFSVRPEKMRLPPRWGLQPLSPGEHDRYRALVPDLLRATVDREELARACGYALLASFPEKALRVLPRALADIDSANPTLASCARHLVLEAGERALPGLRDQLNLILYRLEERPEPTARVGRFEPQELADLMVPSAPEDDPLIGAAIFAIEVVTRHQILEEWVLLRALKIRQRELRLRLACLLSFEQSDRSPKILDQAELPAGDREEIRALCCAFRLLVKYSDELDPIDITAD